jgi:hypothetical protein
MALEKKQSKTLVLEPDTILKRIQKKGDLFVVVLSLKQKLPSLEVLHDKAG